MFNLKKINYGQALTEYRLYQKPIKTGGGPRDRGTRGKGSPRAVAESVRRTQQKIGGLSMSNNWEWFITLTLNPKKVDSFNYGECVDKLSQWLRNDHKRQNKGMAYIVVPERHESGRFHFHGLFSGVDGWEMVDSGKKDNKGRTIYNVGNYPFGWSTATRVGCSIKAANYLTKYITKDLVAVTANKKRYWTTKNLTLPDEVTDLLTGPEMDQARELIKAEATSAHVAQVEAEGYANTIEYYHKLMT